MGDIEVRPVTASDYKGNTGLIRLCWLLLPHYSSWWPVSGGGPRGTDRCTVCGRLCSWDHKSPGKRVRAGLPEKCLWWRH